MKKRSLGRTAVVVGISLALLLIGVLLFLRWVARGLEDVARRIPATAGSLRETQQEALPPGSLVLHGSDTLATLVSELRLQPIDASGDKDEYRAFLEARWIAKENRRAVCSPVDCVGVLYRESESAPRLIRLAPVDSLALRGKQPAGVLQLRDPDVAYTLFSRMAVSSE